MKMKALRMGTNQEADGEGNKGVRTGEEGKGALPSDDRGQSRPSSLRGYVMSSNMVQSQGREQWIHKQKSNITAGNRGLSNIGLFLY